MTSKLALSRPPSSHNHRIQVYLCVHLIMSSQCIPKYTLLWPPSSQDHSFQVHVIIRSITASEYISNARQHLYGNAGVTEVDRVTGSIYSADPGADRHHLISISSYHPMKIHTLSFPTFVLNRSVRDVDSRNWVDRQLRVVSYPFIQFLLSFN